MAGSPKNIACSQQADGGPGELGVIESESEGPRTNSASVPAQAELESCLSALPVCSAQASTTWGWPSAYSIQIQCSRFLKTPAVLASWGSARCPQ